MSIHSDEVFTFLDDVTAKFMLPLGGLMIAIFVGWFMNQPTIMEELEIKSPIIYQSWLWTLRVVSPLGVIAIFTNTLGWF